MLSIFRMHEIMNHVLRIVVVTGGLWMRWFAVSDAPSVWRSLVIRNLWKFNVECCQRSEKKRKSEWIERISDEYLIKLDSQLKSLDLFFIQFFVISHLQQKTSSSSALSRRRISLWNIKFNGFSQINNQLTRFRDSSKRRFQFHIFRLLGVRFIDSLLNPIQGYAHMPRWDVKKWESVLKRTRQSTFLLDIYFTTHRHRRVRSM